DYYCVIRHNNAWVF
nr:immunoglobulin light chain junction region [Macaca mulatta]